MKNPRILFAFCFLSTGIFALVGSLFAWGEGWLFDPANLYDHSLALADLILSTPLLLLAAWGLFQKKRWAGPLGLVVVGILLLGSVLVYLDLWLLGPPYPLSLVVPPIFGLGLSVAYWFWQMAQVPE